MKLDKDAGVVAGKGALPSDYRARAVDAHLAKARAHEAETRALNVSVKAAVEVGMISNSRLNTELESRREKEKEISNEGIN